MNVVANLFALVSKDAVSLTLEIALHQIAKKSMELDTGMVRAGETSAPQTTGRHPEVTPVLLDLDVRGDLRGPEKRVLGLIDGKGLRDAVFVTFIRVVPSRGQLFHWD